MYDSTFSNNEPHDDLPASGSIGAFRHSEIPRPDTAELLAELGIPAHQIRSSIATRATTGTTTAE